MVRHDVRPAAAAAQRSCHRRLAAPRSCIGSWMRQYLSSGSRTFSRTMLPPSDGVRGSTIVTFSTMAESCADAASPARLPPTIRRVVCRGSFPFDPPATLARSTTSEHRDQARLPERGHRAVEVVIGHLAREVDPVPLVLASRTFGARRATRGCRPRDNWSGDWAPGHVKRQEHDSPPIGVWMWSTLPIGWGASPRLPGRALS